MLLDFYMGFRFLLSLSTIQEIRFSRPASVFASRYGSGINMEHGLQTPIIKWPKNMASAIMGHAAT